MSPAERAEFRTTIRATTSDLLAYLERRVGNREDAADLLAETLLQAWRRADDLPSDTERRRMWLFTIAAHVLSNHRRSTRRRAALADRLRRELRESGTEDPAEGTAVRDAVRRLPEPHRELVTLVHWDGFTLVEAAELLGLNPSTARSRYATARERLRRALTEVCAPTSPV